MGRYLSCGIATQIIIYKRYHEENDKILERIGKNFDLNIYDRTDCENGIILKLKEDMIEQHAIVDIIFNGKVLLECYEDLFTYFRNCIIQLSKKNIRIAAVVTIVG